MSDFILIPPDFDPAETLDCGQAFRWEEKDGLWQGIAMGRKLSLAKDGEYLRLDCTQEEFDSIWKHYFDLDTDYNKIKERISAIDPVLKEAVSYAPGIRILRQDPWEAICSFIISQNNNIPRIKGIIKRFCELFGEEVADGLYSFPTAEAISRLTVEDLAPIRSGFRAKYIIAAAQKIAGDENFIPSVYSLPIDEARKALQTIKGIGPKVADCALLYGFHRTDCFPVDVWMKRAMEVLLPTHTPESFGLDAGMAQQYIFHYSRMHPELFPDKASDKKSDKK